MGKLSETIYSKAPHFIQECMVSLFNRLAYRKRHGRLYQAHLQTLKKNETLSLSALQNIQSQKYKEFLSYAHNQSPFYKQRLNGILDYNSINNIGAIPIISKETLRDNLSDVHTIEKKAAIVSKTGGTTGKSLEVYFTENDQQIRHAFLDHFREKYGYRLGAKTAWFSGKNILTNRDVKKNRFWKTDFLHKVRYYSTFHIQDKFLKFYLEDLIRFAPSYMVGFPSTMCEVARYGLANGIAYPQNSLTAIFPTAETITPEIRDTLEGFFKTKLYDQYASSEGAPFITECPERRLHLELQSGVFEVLDNNLEPANKGRLIVTPFNTYGTPLIRYDIGDDIELEQKNIICGCGNQNPLVSKILGRGSDYVYSEETGQINLGNVSNCMKDVKGILNFQVLQDSLDCVKILVVKDELKYSAHDEQTFLKNFRDRVGQKMEINLQYVANIPFEKSGKFRMIKNSIKNQISG